MKRTLCIVVMALTMAASGFAAKGGGTSACDPKKPSLPAPTDLVVVATATTIDASWIGPVGATKWSVEVTTHYLVAPDEHLTFSVFAPSVSIPLVELETETAEPPIAVDVRVKGLNPPTRGKDTSQCNPFTPWVSTEIECASIDYYPDVDTDGFGDDSAAPTTACEQPQGFVDNNGDCNDGNDAINPDETEVCNGVDDNCDGQTDEGTGVADYYPDVDDDGFGDDSASPTSACTQPEGFVDNNTDCNDGAASVNPDGDDSDCNGVDNDCDNTPDDDFVTTACDGDDSDACEDDTFSCVSGSPGCSLGDDNFEVCGDGFDSDCQIVSPVGTNDCPPVDDIEGRCIEQFTGEVCDYD